MKMSRSWSEWFWLPEKYRWQDFEEDGKRFPDMTLFTLHVVAAAVGLNLFRNIVLIPLFLRPLGRWTGIRSKPYRHPPRCEVLEELYEVNRARPPRNLLVKTAAQLNQPERYVERWLRQKALCQQMTTLDKFVDYGWQLTYYTSSFITAILVVCSQPYFKDPHDCFRNYPYNQVPDEIWWYTVFFLGYYLVQTNLLISLDRRHDFYVMLTHHIITLLSTYFSYMQNGTRIFSIGSFSTEIADIPLSLAKMFTYAGYYKIADVNVIVFAILWVATRLIFYPAWILRPLYMSTYTMGMNYWPAFFITTMFASSFMVMNIIWTIDLLVSVKQRFGGKESFSDGRSSSEEMSEGETAQQSVTKTDFVHEATKPNMDKKVRHR